MKINIRISLDEKLHVLKYFWAGFVILTVFVQLSLAGDLNAQESRFFFDRISLDEGLSQSIIRVIYKDSKGFMWIATESGLNKYDGYEFQVYKTNPFDSTSISNNNIQSICEDRNGILWIGTLGSGLNRFDRKTELFRHYSYDPDDATSLSNDFVGLIHEDREDNLWVFTQDGGVDRMDRKSGKFIRYRHDPDDPNTLCSDFITVMVEDSSGRIWIGTVEGLNRLVTTKDSLDSNDSFSFIRYCHDPYNLNSLNYNGILSIYESSAEPGILWIGTGSRNNLTSGGGLNRLDIATGQFTHYTHRDDDPESISSNVVSQIVEDSNGILWIGTTRGLERFDRLEGKFRHFLPDPDNPDSWNNIVRGIHIDLKGNIWVIPLSNNGIYHFDRKTFEFTLIEHNPADPNSLSNNSVTAIYEDPTGVLWIGTNTGGLNKLDHYAWKFKTFAHDPTDPFSLSSNIVRSMFEDHLGRLWVGVMEDGLNEFDKDRKRVNHYRFNPGDSNSLSNDDVFAVLEDRAGVLWVGTAFGLNRLDRRSQSFTRYIHEPGQPGSLSNNTIRAIFEDKSNRLWIRTDGGGLNLLDRETEIFTPYLNDPDDPTSLSNNAIRAIAEDQDGILWVGTWGGLNRLVVHPRLDSEDDLGAGQRRNADESEVFHEGRAVFIHYRYDPSNSNTLSNDGIQSLYVDKEGIIWIGTHGGGLNRFDPKTESFKHYTEQNSDFPNNTIYGVLGDEKGNIWLSSNRGLTKFNP